MLPITSEIFYFESGLIYIFQGYYDAMDAGYKDEYGYVYVTARDDDIINVAGHRISTSALEDVVLAHPDISDATVVGVPESTKGEVPLCLFILKKGKCNIYKAPEETTFFSFNIASDCFSTFLWNRIINNSESKGHGRNNYCHKSLGECKSC